MKLCRSDLDTATDSEAQSLGNLKHAKNHTRRQECLLLAQKSGRKPRRIRPSADTFR
jgi:hypothetical protein